MPLAPRTRGIPVVLQHVRHQRATLGNAPVIAFPVIGKLGDDPVARPVMVAPGQQRGTSRRAHRRRVKPVVGDPLPDDPIHRRRLDLATERRRVAGATVVDHHDQDVRSIVRQPTRRHTRLVTRLLHGAPRDTRRRRRRKRKRLLLFHYSILLAGSRIRSPSVQGSASSPGQRLDLCFAQMPPPLRRRVVPMIEN